ncbi:MAG: ATP-binding protein [Clostridia bacterium]|nr:ATP-binding protein [Clostridia bacterium]
MNLKDAVNFIVRRRAEDLIKSRAVLNELINSNPRFREAELNKRAVELNYALGKASEQDYALAVSKRDEVVASLGLNDILNPPYHCPKCKDTGLIGSKFCECAKTLSINSTHDLIRFTLNDFSSFKPEMYGDNAPYIAKIIADLKTIAQKGSSAVRKNINLLGRAGTGKTFLASCFANECVKRGMSVVFITAFDFFERCRKYHTTYTADKEDFLSPLLSANVLIIDDLGTESILKNITVEYLYSIINERQLDKKLTFITSNLTINEFALRYSERTASRIFDKKLCYTHEFSFDDIRKIKLS